MGTIKYDIITYMKDTELLAHGRTPIYSLNYHIIWEPCIVTLTINVRKRFRKVVKLSKWKK